ncbi:hypothetical protein [Jeotgalicoccus sp. WY2]|uniref:hypothetical protein n=1 Tax=Jeotgalicoccus sp. WY2 TaxID=2708346 RepID=UPI001BD65E42|nr:hypothetical protein [Jeotgalicoccus sp. WY2]
MWKIVRITIDIAEFQKNPENVFKTAEKEQSVGDIDGDTVAGVLMSKAQYEFARDEIESLYDVIDELTVMRISPTRMRRHFR